MRTNILPADLAIKVLPTDDNGKPIITFRETTPYVKAILQYLQSHQISLNTADFVDAIMQSLELNPSDLTECGLTLGLYQALITEHIPASAVKNEIFNIILEWLEEQGFSLETFCYYRAIVTADYPMPSTLNPTKIAVWRNTSKMGDWDKRQAVSVRKWIGSTFKDLTVAQTESLAKRIDLRLASLMELDIRHHSSYEFEAWKNAYESDKITSCMHPALAYGIGHAGTFTCYCTGYHGLPDNGLNLTVLYQDDTPVARAITFTDGEQKFYIRAYGDSRLERRLIHNGYKQSDFTEGTILYTTERLIKPYVDGWLCMADHCTTNDGKHYWLLCKGAEYNLQTTDAYARGSIE